MADVFLTAWNKIESAPAGEDALRWLYRIAFLTASLPALESTLHLFGTPWIELDHDAGTAAVETYSINSVNYPPGADGRVMQNVSGTRYEDRFALRDGSWAIVERRNRRVWAHNLAEEGEPAPPVAGPGPVASGGTRSAGD